MGCLGDVLYAVCISLLGVCTSLEKKDLTEQHSLQSALVDFTDCSSLWGGCADESPTCGMLPAGRDTIDIT